MEYCIHLHVAILYLSFMRIQTCFQTKYHISCIWISPWVCELFEKHYRWLFIWCCWWTISRCAFTLRWRFIQIWRRFVFFFYWFAVWWRRRVIGWLGGFIRWSRGTVGWRGLIIRWSGFLFWFFVGRLRSCVRWLFYWFFICRFWCAIWRSFIQIVVRWSVWSWNFITI